MFANSPITYTLAASLTIITCYRLKLHAGLLVATITAVAMVEVVYDNYFLSFFTRLGTTTVGIVVSTLVNMFILPPNYMKEIDRNVQTIYTSIGQVLENILHTPETVNENLEKLNKKLTKTEELIRFQQEESYYHPLVDSKKESFNIVQKQLRTLRYIHYHLHNLETINYNNLKMTPMNRDIVTKAITELVFHMTDDGWGKMENNEKKLRNLLEMFWSSSHPIENTNTEKLPQELILLYELISIFYLVKQLKTLRSTQG